MTVIICDAEFGVMATDRGAFVNGFVQPTSKLFALDHLKGNGLCALDGNIAEFNAVITAFTSGQPYPENCSSTLLFLTCTSVAEKICPSDRYGGHSNLPYQIIFFDENGLVPVRSPFFANYDAATPILKMYCEDKNRAWKTIKILHELENNHVGYGWECQSLSEEQDNMEKNARALNHRYSDEKIVIG